MGKYFGTDGFRGEVGRVLDARHAFLIGQYLGYICKQQTAHPKIAIGKDTRRSSYTLEYALAAGLTAMGTDAHILHVTTTPCVSFVTRTQGFDAGIMISASHNPFYDNGIKLFDANGEKMDEAVIAGLEAYLDAPYDLPPAVGEQIGVVVDAVACRNRYIGHLISLATVSYRGYRVGLDLANGSAWMMAKSVFDALGATTFVIHNTPDGVNINRGAGSTHIEALQALVKEKGLDVGFAFDGDADRCLCVDENGDVVSGDHILYILGDYMQKKGQLDNNTVVTTVMSNFGLYKAFDKVGIDYAKTKVGDKYVYEYMVANGCRLGGEQSGHIIISKYATTGDGILTSLKVMEVMMAKKKTLSQLCKDLTIYPQVLKNVRVQDKAAAQNDPEVQKAVQAVADQLGSTGRILVRESGTEPVIRVMVEAATKEECQQYVDAVVDVICRQGHARV